MTAVPHESLRSARLTSAGIRSRVGSRMVRPSTSRTGSGRQSDRSAPAGAGISGGAAVLTAPVAAKSTSAIGIGQIRLVLAGRRVRMGSGAFVLLVLGLLTATLVALLFINTSLAENSFQLQNIRQTARDLTVREQILNGQLAAAESPVGLEARAKELGMVAGGSPVFLRLSDGKVLGESEPAPNPPAPAKKKKADPAAAGLAGETPVGTTAGGETPVGTVAGETAVGIDPVTGLPVTETPVTGGEQAVGIVPGATR